LSFERRFGEYLRPVLIYEGTTNPSFGTFPNPANKLTIYNGIVGKADLKIIADHDAILALSLINIFMGLPNYFDETGRDILKKLIRGSLKIEGLLKHPLKLVHLTKIFSVN
jgi:hypothetical protein